MKWFTYVLICWSILTVLGAPVNIEDNLVEPREEGLMLLVPTLPVDKNGNPTKREIEYELIIIPPEILKREIRSLAASYNLPRPSGGGGNTLSGHSSSNFAVHGGGGGGNTFTVITDSIEDTGELVFPASGVPLPTYNANSIHPVGGGGGVPLPAPSLPLLPLLPVFDIGQVLGTAGNAAGNALKTGGHIAHGASSALVTAGQFGHSAAAGGAQAVRWVIDTKSQGLATATQVVSGGLQYAGQLSSAVLRTLLQVPGIKARVISEIVRAGQPLATAISDVIADSADDLGDLLEAKTEILRDAVGIIIRLVQDTLALNGRILASFGAGGLDSGASLFNAGVRIGGAFVESAGKVATAVGRGVGDIVKVASAANIPPPPQLPPLALPSIPQIHLPILTSGGGLSSGSPTLSQTYGTPGR